MNIAVSAYIITGIMLGLEHVHVDNTHFVVIDILFVRLTIEIAGEE
jgi:hypothetical protein